MRMIRKLLPPSATSARGSKLLSVTGLCAAMLVPVSILRAEMVTHLFTSWYGIDAGNTVFKVNRAKVDPETLKVIEQVKDYYKIELTDGDSAPIRVSVPEGVKLRAEMATKTEPWLIADKPWEAGGVWLQRVIHEGGLYRVWYSCSEIGGRDKVIVSPVNGRPKLGSEGGERVNGMCYMESRDAKNWVKPSLGLVEFRGSKDNNILPGAGPAIFIDRAAPPAERYKSISNARIRDFDPTAAKDGPALAGAVSPDGIHWTRLPQPVTDWKGATLANDGSPEAHYDEKTGNYVLYTRANYPRRRSIASAVTTDFRRWPVPAITLTPGPDDDPSVDFYDNPYLFYPGSASSHLMLVSSYHRNTSEVNLRMATSMDGDAWNWLSPRPVLKVGRTGDWDGGQLYAYGDMVRLPDGRVAVGITGISSRHEEYWRAKWEEGRSQTNETAWAVWEDGRVAGVEAENAGEFTTLPLKATGQPIEINARTGNSGSVRVEVLIEEPGRPIHQVALQAGEMSGDIRWQPLAFTQGRLADLAGKTIRLRFHLYNAKVFGMRGDGLEWVSSYARK